MCCQICLGNEPPVLLGIVSDRPPYFTLVESIAAAAGQRAEGASQVRLTEDLAWPWRSPLNQVVSCSCGILLQLCHFGVPVFSSLLHDWKPVLCTINSRREQIRKFHGAVLFQ